ncbi:BREX system ATP-binding protein BrxD [Sorangium sp. So ce119]|uniref:BREX system ATP-binding protein BrxD n=1 Tax=Sorangium sp. So ce119 TaxID=3133279 RepID=UPI003F60B763
MSEVNLAQARDIVAALRAGAVPRSGLEQIATGLDRILPVIEEELDEVAAGEGRGRSKWIRGEYGSGKTFATRLICARARQKRFATTEVQISINDTPLHHLETVYRRMMERLTTDAQGEGALRAVVDAWIFEVGEEVLRLKGIGEDDPQFAGFVEARLEEKLAELSVRNPAFSQVLRAYNRALGEGDYQTAQGLLAWLAGQPHIDRSITARAGVKGAVDGQAALTFLRGILTILRQSGHAGLVVVLDEVETVQRMPPPTREKSLNALRQLVDMLANAELPGMYLLVTGTPSFFDDYKGLKGLPPLYQRIATRFDETSRFDNLRALQVRLLPFDERRLVEVGRRVRDLFPSRAAERKAARVGDAFLRAMAAQVTRGFGGKVSVCPRWFLRDLVDVLDKVEQYEDYDPANQYELVIDEAALTPEELAARRGTEPAYPETRETEEADGASTRRLDG